MKLHWINILLSTDPLLARLFEAFRSPRVSMRRGLDEAWAASEQLLIVLAGAAVQAIAMRIAIATQTDTGAAAAMLGQLGSVGFYLALFLAGLMQYAIFGAALWAVGGAFGGTGGARACFSAAAWWSLVSALLSPLALAPFAFVSLAVFFVSLWLLASFAAEAHGFKSIGATMAVSMTLMMLAVAAMMLMLGGLLPKP